MAVNYGTAVGKVRSLIPDISDDPILSDEQIEAYLSLSADNIYLATAMALRTIANEVNLLLKVVRTDDLSVNGAQTAAELRKTAEDYEKKAAAELEQESEDFFEISNFEFGLDDPWRSLGLP